MGKIIYLGDIHCQFNYIKSLIVKQNIGNEEKITYIIQVGDFGAGYDPINDPNTFIEFNLFCIARNIIFLAIRGNHDNPIYFNGDYYLSNFKLLKDYTVMEIHGKNHLFVGGAISINRTELKQDTNYWIGEKFVLNEEILKNLYGIDVVVTHTTPEYCFPDNRVGYGIWIENHSIIDKKLKSDLDKERNDLARLFRILDKNGNFIQSHYYGHFHRSNITMNGYTNHYLLNINEFVYE